MKYLDIIMLFFWFFKFFAMQNYFLAAIIVLNSLK
ncbi:hypothetical protein SMU54_03937 [Streptococcus mutans A9]|nr:hypothetical protein SMU54_03937 [Streptococcus mutans A9]EMC49167.1 hypothetical protein SMU104_08404 [Streptococcus mutans SA41]